MKRYTWGVLKNAAQEGCGYIKLTLGLEEEASVKTLETDEL